ncbi:FAD dependent oxidoreductase [Halothece sp. PCC 7418]|nr:FAD dependent oxidoreductase [Halothece sp. PCC 7418]
MIYDQVIIGGGIVGLATAMQLAQKSPKARILLLEKETDLAAHQTSHNSGVIHSGIYYKPGSFKAKFCRDGSRSMVEFCQEHNLDYEVCGKVIIATQEQELPRLERLYQRGLENGISVKKLRGEAIQELEPHVRCLAGIRVNSTGITDYKKVCQKYAQILRDRAGELKFNTQVTQLQKTADGYVIETNQGDFQAKFIINCAGLHSDRVAKLGAVNPQAKIIPFRGEYYELKPEKRYLVKNLIYPVPNPNFPFLGVHFTRMIDGSVHAGPNAVLSFKREGYQKTDWDRRDLIESLTYPGLWKLAAKYGAIGVAEMIRSWSKTAFVRSLQRLIPEIQPEDVIPISAGVRAQALKQNGALVDDFLMIEGRKALHICNAPSPAATASLEIGKAIADRVLAMEMTVQTCS